MKEEVRGVTERRDSQLGSLGNNVRRSPRSFGEEAGPRSRLGIWLGREALLVKTCGSLSETVRRAAWLGQGRQGQELDGDGFRGSLVSDKGG